MPEAVAALLMFLAFCGVAAVVFVVFLLVKMVDLYTDWGEAVCDLFKSVFRIDQ